jgi:WD40 repeat protein
VWNFEQRRATVNEPLGQMCFSVGFTPDGSELWIGTGRVLVSDAFWEGGAIERRSMSTGRVLPPLSGHRDIVVSIDFSPDGRTAATSSLDRTIAFWDISTGKKSRSSTSHSLWVFSVGFSSNGQTLASGSADSTVKLWHVPTGEELFSIPMPHTPVAVAFSPDGNSLVAGLADERIFAWHAAADRQSWPAQVR